MRGSFFKSIAVVLGLSAGGMLAPATSARALPLAPAPALDSPIADAQYGVRPHRPGVRPGVRPAARPMRPVARPVVRPVRPAVRPVRPVSRPVIVRPGVRPIPVRPGVRPIPVRPAPAVRYAPRYYGSWYRPYRWRPGGAIVAGAAIGFLSAAAVGTYYYTVPRPPRPDLCWYYTDPTRTSGFWDFCP